MQFKDEKVSVEIEYDHFCYISPVDEEPITLLWTDLSPEERQAFERLFKEGVSICDRLFRLYMILKQAKKRSKVA